MKKMALSVLSALTLVGCVDARHVQDPQGEDYLHINCASLNTMKPITAKCQARATKECPGGYLVVHNSISLTGDQNRMILKCDRNPADASKNVSRYTAFGTLLNVNPEVPYKGAYADLKVNSSEAPAPVAPTATTVTTTQKAVVADKTGTTEVTATDKTTVDKANGKKEETVTKTTKISQKDKKEKNNKKDNH